MDVKVSNESGEISLTGATSTSANPEVLSLYIRTQQQRFVVTAIVSVCFILSSCFLIIFAPGDRVTLMVPVALGLLAVGLGLGGFTLFKLKALGSSLDASGRAKGDG